MSAVKEQGERVGPRVMMAPWLPLALLESIRMHDRPREVLEDEDLAASLPRRLGLTGVIETRIHRYEEEARRGRDVPVEEVLDLLRLVMRRPDAEPILRDAGAQVARRHFGGSTPRRSFRLLPRAARTAAVRRSVRAMLRRVVGPGRLEVTGWPLRARITDALTARADPGGTACVLYSAALEELVHLHTGSRPQVGHNRCAVHGEPCCEWMAMA
ncbi:MAG TPA: hypothetical protein VF188_16810 [Longimicrobiales bacterium]